LTELLGQSEQRIDAADGAPVAALDAFDLDQPKTRQADFKKSFGLASQMPAHG